MVLAAMNVAMVPDSSYILDSNFKTGGSSNHGYSNPEVDRLLNDASKTKDQEKRLEYFNQVQEIVQEELPFITVAYYGLAIAMKDSVKGYVFDPTAHDYKLNPEMYIEK